MELKKNVKCSLALFFVGVLLAGVLPLPDSPKIQAAGYGLNNPSVDDKGVVTWDCVYFGKYWQEDTNGDGKADKNDAKTPIK
ncbi:MAG: hypothetical protein NC293_13060 [Roseburia sp.]|nr:hypothetical protein [Roseburia sp.]